MAAKINLKLKTRIIEKYRTQADFADVVKTSDMRISQVVRGRRKPNKEEKKRWAEALESTVDNLFGE